MLFTLYNLYNKLKALLHKRRIRCILVNGQWSARKSQLLAKEYKKAGGGYRGQKSSQAKSLDRWTDQKWRTKDGKPAIRQGYTTRYLPDKEWNRLSEGQAIATNRKKIKGSKADKQFVANTARARQ